MEITKNIAFAALASAAVSDSVNAQFVAFNDNGDGSCAANMSEFFSIGSGRLVIASI